MKMTSFRTIIAAAGLLIITFFGIAEVKAQESPQKAVASKSAKFESVAKTDALYTNALDAHDKAAAGKLTDKDGSFRGTVTKIFTTRDGGILIVNFDRDYKTALTAVLRKVDFSKFPDMTQLDGKQIVVSGKFTDFRGDAQIALTDPKQIALVK